MSDLGLDIEAASRAIRSASRVVICGHVSPDGDCMGSVLGLTLGLRTLGIDAVPTLADERPAPVTYAFLPGHDLFRAASDLEPPALFVALDAASLDRLGSAVPLAEAADMIVNIDHHAGAEAFGHVNAVDPDAAAVGQILWHMLPSLGVEASPGIATCLYVAVMTDTGRFSYGNTDPAVLRDAAAMVEAGADPFHAYSAVYEARSASYLRLLGIALSRVTHANKGRVAYSWIAEEDLAATGTLPEETEDLVDVVRSVGDVEAILLVKLVDGQARVSLRAKGPADVGSAARALGGGGHRAAAGATVKGGLDEALAAVLPLLPGGSDR